MELAHDTLMSCRNMALCKEYMSDDVFDEDYLFETEEDAENELCVLLDKFDELKNKKWINIYRSLELEDIKYLDREFLGECWAWDEDAAHNFAINNLSNLDNVYILYAKVPSESIDWMESYKRYFINSLGNYGMEENELVVKYQSDIKLLEIR